MKNVTVSMPDELAQWTRVCAARNGKSVSRYLSDLLAERMQEEDRYRQARDSFFSRAPDNLSCGQRYPARNDLHER